MIEPVISVVPARRGRHRLLLGGRPRAGLHPARRQPADEGPGVLGRHPAARFRRRCGDAGRASPGCYAASILAAEEVAAIAGCARWVRLVSASRATARPALSRRPSPPLLRAEHPGTGSSLVEPERRARSVLRGDRRLPFLRAPTRRVDDLVVKAAPPRRDRLVVWSPGAPARGGRLGDSRRCGRPVDRGLRAAAASWSERPMPGSAGFCAAVIRDGRLPAVRRPGGRFRTRVAVTARALWPSVRSGGVLTSDGRAGGAAREIVALTLPIWPRSAVATSATLARGRRPLVIGHAGTGCALPYPRRTRGAETFSVGCGKRRWRAGGAPGRFVADAATRRFWRPRARQLFALKSR